MNRRTSILSAVVAIVVTTLAMVTVAFAAQKGDGQGQENVTICHEGHTITVGEPALAVHEQHGDTEGACATTGQDRPKLHPGAKITLKLLRLGESESLAEVYASDHTGFKVERAMRKGLKVFCHPGDYDTVTFTCEEGATPPPETTTPETTTPETTVPETTTPETTTPETTTPETTTPETTTPATTTPETTTPETTTPEITAPATTP
jgi:hypothetical protein